MLCGVLAVTLQNRCRMSVRAICRGLCVFTPDPARTTAMKSHSRVSVASLDGLDQSTNRASDKSICHLGGARGSGYLFQATPLGKRSGPTAAPESSANGKLRPADEPRPPNFPFARYRGAVGRNASQRPRKACNNSAAALAWELFRHFLIECQTDFSGSARGMISSRSVCAPRDQ